MSGIQKQSLAAVALTAAVQCPFRLLLLQEQCHSTAFPDRLQTLWGWRVILVPLLSLVPQGWCPAYPSLVILLSQWSENKSVTMPGPPLYASGCLVRGVMGDLTVKRLGWCSLRWCGLIAEAWRMLNYTGGCYFSKRIVWYNERNIFLYIVLYQRIQRKNIESTQKHCWCANILFLLMDSF